MKNTGKKKIFKNTRASLNCGASRRVIWVTEITEERWRLERREKIFEKIIAKTFKFDENY